MAAQNVERTAAHANHAQHVKPARKPDSAQYAQNGDDSLANAAGVLLSPGDAFAHECDGVLIY